LLASPLLSVRIALLLCFDLNFLFSDVQILNLGGNLYAKLLIGDHFSIAVGKGARCML
jgi:hypothetical protein